MVVHFEIYLSPVFESEWLSNQDIYYLVLGEFTP